MQIKGKSIFSSTTKKVTKGKYPSGKYEVGIYDVSVVNGADDEISNFNSIYQDRVQTIEVDLDGQTVEIQSLKIKNSEYEFPMFDKHNNRLSSSVPLKNGTNITLDISIKHSDTYNKDYIVVNAIRVDEDIVEFNPFK